MSFGLVILCVRKKNERDKRNKRNGREERTSGEIPGRSRATLKTPLGIKRNKRQKLRQKRETKREIYYSTMSEKKGKNQTKKDEAKDLKILKNKRTSPGGQIDASAVVLCATAMFLGCFGRTFGGFT